MSMDTGSEVDDPWDEAPSVSTDQSELQPGRER
jgi:hypothetical protein